MEANQDLMPVLLHPMVGRGLFLNALGITILKSQFSRSTAHVKHNNFKHACPFIAKCNRHGFDVFKLQLSRVGDEC